MPRKRFDVEARVSVKDAASKNVKKIDSGFKRLTKTIKTSALAQVAAIGGAVLALRGMVRAIGAVIRAANVQEDAISELDRALASLGPTAGSVSKALQEQAAALQKTTTFGDEVIIKSQALIASFIKEESQIKAATIATLDLAKAKGFDLVTAADLISKTLGSSTNALTRYGIEVVGAVGSTERLESLTTNVAKVFGGAAAKATETFSGKITQLNNAWGDLLEGVGAAITENEGAIKSIDNLTESVEDAAPGIAELAIGFIGLAESYVQFLKDSGDAVRQIVLFTEGTRNLDGSVKVAAVSQLALAATAKRLGITISELNALMGKNIATQKALSAASQETASSMETAADKAAKLAAAQAELKKQGEEAATAMEQLGAALNTVTSAELAGEIVKIEAALETVRVTTGGIGPEFERLQVIATQEIASIESRIEGLRDGLGDLGKTTEDATGAIDKFGNATATTGSKVAGMTNDLAVQARQAEVTAAALQRLTAVAESLALAQARTALAITQEERRNVGKSIGASSGSSSQQRGSYTGLPVGNVGTFIVQPDGTLRPA